MEDFSKLYDRVQDGLNGIKDALGIENHLNQGIFDLLRNELEDKTPKEVRLVLMVLEGLGLLGKYSSIVYYRKFIECLGGEPDYLARTADFYPAIERILTRHLGIEIRVHTQIPRLAPDERAIIMGNHPSAFILFSWLNQAVKVTQDLKIVAKQQMVSDWKMAPPFVGIPANLAGMLILVDRNKGGKDALKIEESINRGLIPGSAAVIFPDSIRVSLDPEKERQRIEAAQQLIARHYPDSKPETWLHYTGAPRLKGLEAMLRGTQHRPPRLFNITTAFDRPESTNMQGATLNVYVEELAFDHFYPHDLKDSKEKSDHLGEQMVNLYRQMNSRIRDWRNSMTQF